jgi:predicted regulator of Ras-like GTPase activity (Roadblock/LC7/MglB family)
MLAGNLESYLKLDGVLAALVVSDSTVQEEAGSPGAETSMLAVTLTLLMKESARIAGKVGAGQVSSVVLEFGDRLLLVHAEKDNQFLVVITSQAISLTGLYLELGITQAKEGPGA